MKLSLKWLKEYVEIPEHLTAEQLGNLITLHTAEVDSVDNTSEAFADMVVGKITELKPHPNADKLRITTTDIGSKKVQIVCGGSNLYMNQLVAIALPGSKVKWHGEGDLITLEATTIRGEESFGMICASDEIGMGPSKDHEIMDLTYLELAAGTPLDKALNKDDILFDIDNKAITHRPDLWSHYGFAREISALTGGKLKTIDVSEIESKIPSKGEQIKLKVSNPEILKKWSSIIVNNIQIQESPVWLKEKLESIGARSVNNIVDITNLVMFELGQPLHAYDKNLLGDLNLEIRFAKKSEKLETLDHKERELTEIDPILVNSDQKPVIILGVMGGANSEVSEGTTSILLESACFDAVTIRKSSTYHGLRSDASQRFEKSLDPNQAVKGLLRALQLILEICPEATIAGPITEMDFFDKKDLKIELDPNKVSKYLGIDLPESQIQEILESLEFKVEGKNPFVVSIPTFRANKDILTEVDLIEEVVRIYGYEKIEELLPSLPTKSPIQNLARKREHQARNVLKSYGLSEVLNYSFYSEKNLKDSLLDEKNHLQLKNYLSEEQTHLRTSLVTNILKNCAENLKQFSEIKIFEIGRTYIENGQFFPTEEDKLAIAVTGNKNNFAVLKGILEGFMQEFSQEPLEIIVALETPNYLHPRKSIQITNSENIEIGFAGVIHPLVQENFKLDSEVAYAEINLARLTHQKTYAKQFSPIAKFPGIEFDLSILVSKNVYAETLVKTLNESSDLIHTVQLFDIYEDASLGQDQKALAFKIELRSDERTLTENDLAQARDNCIANINKIGGTIRGQV